MTRWRTLAVLAVVLVGAGCRQAPEPRPPGTAVGDVRAGEIAITSYGCGSCHSIPGIADADAFVGPPLDSWSRRSFIAGTLPNNASNLVTWLQEPDEVRPGTAMPDLDVTDSDARDIAAYLLDIE